MLSSFDQFLDRVFPDWRQMPVQVLNTKLEETTGAILLRLRHRRCTVFGIPQLTLTPKNEYWLSQGHWMNIQRHIQQEWSVQVRNPAGPYIYLKNDPGSLYPIDLVHNLEDEDEEEILSRQKVERNERWIALISTANRIANAEQACANFENANFQRETEKKVERLARRFIQIVLNS